MRRVGSLVMALCLLVLNAGGLVDAQALGNSVRVSVSTSGQQGDANSSESSASRDGRYVVFASFASNLVPGDTNNKRDIFVRDIVSGTTTRVSVSSAGDEANDHSDPWPSISEDGRYVVFASTATNLIPFVVGLTHGVYRHDLVTGKTESISVLPNGSVPSFGGSQPQINADGRFVVYTTTPAGANAVLGREDIAAHQIIMRDMVNGVNRLVSVSSNGAPADDFTDNPSIDCSGKVVSFHSNADNLAPNDVNGFRDVFVADLSGAQNMITNVTVGANGVSAIDRGSTVSCDGDTLVYRSSASNIVSGDTNGVDDIYKYSIPQGSSERVSFDVNGQQRTYSSVGPDVSNDGRFIAYSSSLPFAGNIYSYVFVYDSVSGATVNASVDSAQQLGNSGSGGATITADGDYVIYTSLATNLVAGDTNGASDVFKSGTGFVADSTPPVVTGSANGAPSSSGWYDDDVMITWTSVDPSPSSGAPTQPNQTLANVEGEHTYTSAQSCDPAGNCSTGSLTLKIDKTAPTLALPVWSQNPKPVTSSTTMTVPVTENLSGIRAAEYFLGDTDPGQGNGATMHIGADVVGTSFGTDFPTGVYKVTVRVQDGAGNWSAGMTDYLVVFNPSGYRMTGKSGNDFVPSTANGDVLPNLIAGSTEVGVFGFSVRYSSSGVIDAKSDFQFKYNTGTKCRGKKQTSDCHVFELNANAIDWLTTSGANDGTGIFQGRASLNIDGAVTQVVFRVTGTDGFRMLNDPNATDNFQLQIYPEGANPSTASPIYHVNSTALSKRSVRIR